MLKIKHNLFYIYFTPLRVFSFLCLFFNIFFVTSFAAKTEFYTQDDVLKVFIDTDSGTNISIKSERIDLSSAIIGWYFDGKKVLEGENKTVFFSKNKVYNKKVQLKIKDSKNGLYEVEFDLSGSDLFVYWEAINSTAPVWWQGKTQVSFGNQVRVWVMADIYDDLGSPINNKDLNYLWYIDDIYNEKKSGFGREFSDIYIGLNSYNDTKIRVVVKLKTGDVVGDNTILIKNTDTEASLYKQIINQDNGSNLVGEYVFDFVYLKNFDSILEKNFNLVIEPMFFGILDKSFLKYSWTINNQKSDTNSFVNNINIKPKTYGDFKINLNITNPNNKEESLNKKMSITIK